MMKRVLSLLLTVAITGNIVVAQKVDDGVRALYYERYKSAKDILGKIVAEDPKNAEAAYWLGQTLLKSKDSAGAKAVYQKAMTDNGNNPLTIVGMGQVMLMEGKKDEARQQFETAINMTKGKNVEILNAVARANVDARQGDATYAIEKLNQATQTRKFKNAQTYLLMGNAYRKLIDGGNAVTSYTKALELEPNLAAAKNNIGKIYESQKNPEFYLPAYEDATKLDTAYAPAYFNLFYHYYFRDVNKAGDYLNRYIANSDPGPDMEYIKTDYTYAKGDFAGAKQRAEQLIQQFGPNVNPRMYRMVAFTADTLGDANAAKAAMDTFLAKSHPGPELEDIKPTDYELLAKINSKIPGQEAEVFANYEKAIAMDTALAGKLQLIQNAARLARNDSNRHQEAVWLGRAYALEKEPSQRDLYNWAYAHYQAGDYTTADSLFCGQYIPKYPDAIYGYLWCARAKQAQDTSMEQGLAVDAYKTLAQKAVELDSAGTLKNTAKTALFYLVAYYNDIAKEKDTAIAYTEKVLEIDPADENATRVLKILTAPPPKATKQPATKPKSGSSTKKKTASK